jgi:hypothetical protein
MGDLANALVIIGITLLVFLICRELVCWYFKLNKINDTLTEIRDLLQKNIESVNSK